MPQYSNISEVPLSLQVFLATDSYEYNDDPKTVSVTSLIKPLKQYILGKRTNQDSAMVDLSQLVASRIGTAIHDGIERSWMTNYKLALKLLNYPDRVIDKVLINPTKEELFDNCIPVYLEQRAERQINGYTISGKFDFVSNGMVEDFKTTGVYTYISNTNEKKYIEQGSIYRWLNPEIITNDQMAITYIFTDWSAIKARTDPNYPQKRFHQKLFNLMSLQETERFVVNKLKLIEQYMDANEDVIPQCTPEDLWISESVFKYYKDPNKTQRSTKNFDSKSEAYIYMSQKGTGIVIEKPGEAKACRYCAGFDLCTQKDTLIANGDLTL
jgi:hypothetical protein